MKKVLISIAMIISLVFSYMSYYIAMRYQHTIIQYNFENLANARALAIAENINKNIDVIHTISLFYMSSNHVSRDEFKQFVTPLLQRHPTIHALEWIPQIRATDRNVYVENAKKSITDFEIKVKNEKGVMVKSPKKSFYYPVYYVEPLAPNKKALGYDLSSNTIRNSSLEKSIAINKPVATASISLVQESSNHTGILIFLPIFSETETRVNINSPDFKGFSLGVFRVDDILKTSLNSQRKKGIYTSIHDLSAAGTDELLATFSDTGEQPTKVQSYHYEQIIDVADRQWLISFKPTKSYLTKNKTLAPVFIGTASFTIVLLVSFVFLILTNRNKEVQALVAARTIELNQKNIDLIKASKKADELNRMKSQFLANMSHELRTPMNGIVGMSSLLLESDLNESQVHHANVIQRSAKSLMTILNDILDYSKIESGSIRLEKVSFDLTSLIDDACSLFIEKAIEKNIELICPANPVEYTWLDGDPTRIKQVLVNLLGNAVKFTENGEVAVYMHILSQSSDEIHFRIEVIDSGIGINEKDSDRLFQRFEQADGSTTREYGGTGLGLPISKQLIEMMGGEIGFKSHGSGGSIFWFTLSLQKSQNKYDAINHDSLRAKQILIIESNKTTRDLLVELTSLWGLESVSCSSGSQAIKLIQNKQSNFSFVLLDCNLTDINCPDIASQIKLADSNITLYLLGYIEQCQNDNNIDHFINKPIMQNKLLELLLNQDKVKAHAEDSHTTTQYTGNILVVDDNRTNQDVAKAILTNMGILPAFASNGEEAISMIKEKTFDLVFMDCQMPIVDGYTATRVLRETGFKDLPIVAMTANAMKGDKEKCLAVGMNDFIAKPIEPFKIKSVLNKWLNNENIELEPNQDLECATYQSDDIIDFERLKNKMMNDDALIYKLLAVFLEDMDSQLALLQSAVEARDCQEVGLIGHRIKGAASNFYADKFTQLAYALEKSGKANQSDNLERLYHELNEAYQALKSEIIKRDES